MRGGAACGAPPLLLLGALLAAWPPAPAHAVLFEAGFQCPPASTTNTSCLCTSGCSINSEFSYLWSAPQYPPPSRGLGIDTICGAVTLPCTPATSDLTAYLGTNGYVRGTSVTGFHFFQGCAPGALVTIYTGFTGQECELLRIRFASLARADPGTPYPVPRLCNTNNCNGDAGVTVGGVPAAAGGAGGGGSSGAAPVRALGVGVAAAAAALALL